MIVKRKLYSVMDEEGNMGYYLYNEATGEEKLFSVVEEEERMYARGVGSAVEVAMKRASSKGNKIANKAANREHIRSLGKEGKKLLGISKYLKFDPSKEGVKHDLDTIVGKLRLSDALENKSNYPRVLKGIDRKIPGNIEENKGAILKAASPRWLVDLPKKTVEKYYKIR